MAKAAGSHNNYLGGEKLPDAVDNGSFTANGDHGVKASAHRGRVYWFCQADMLTLIRSWCRDLNT